MAILVEDILRRTDNMLNDIGRVRWTLQERLDWLNDAAGAIIIRRPAAFSKTTVQALVLGTRQKIPVGHSELLDVVRNIGADGQPGRPIGIVDRKLLDDSDPEWHSARPASYVANYTHDGRTPTQFYVYPPAKAGIQIELTTTALPVKVVAATDMFDINAEYMEAITNFICYRSMIKDGEFANAALATGFYSAFQEALGVQTQAVQSTAPESASI